MKKIFLPALIVFITSAGVAQKQPPRRLESLPVKEKPDMNLIRERKTIPPEYNFTNLHICIDKLSLASLPPKPAVLRIPKIKSNGELEQVSSITQGLSGVTDKMWSPGDIIIVGFNTG